MGGKTPTRLVDSCEMYLEADEMAIYEAWIKGNKQVMTLLFIREHLYYIMCVFIYIYLSLLLYLQPNGIKEYLCKNFKRIDVPAGVSEELDLNVCMKDGVKHVADEL